MRVSAKQRLCDRRFAVVAETVSACAPLIGFPFRPVYTRVAACFDFLTAVHNAGSRG